MNCIFNSLIEISKEEIIKQHCEDSLKLSFDELKQTHTNYNVQIDSNKLNQIKQSNNQGTHDSKLDAPQDQFINDTKNSDNNPVVVSQPGKYPEFARYIKDSSEKQ